MSKFTEELVRVATSQIGVREISGNNKGPMIVEYQKTTWLKPSPWPWCAAFITWCIKETLNSKDVKSELGITTLTQSNKWRPRTASAWDFDNWGEGVGFSILTENDKAKAGDIVTFDFSHIGIVIEDQVGDSIVTVEGNTNNKGERDSLSGDGVWKKTRHWKLIRTLIRQPNIPKIDPASDVDKARAAERAASLKIRLEKMKKAQ